MLPSLRRALHNGRRALRGAPDGLPIPPLRLIRRVAGVADVEWFLASGRITADCIRAALGRHGIDPTRMAAILDFGCGCGRVLRHWEPSLRPRVRGTDADAEMIAWCRGKLSAAGFAVNRVRPPLDEPDERYDLVYALSVFTHLPAELQRPWIDELRRVLAPGGCLLLTTHGEHYFGELAADERRLFRAGHLVVRNAGAAGEQDCAVFHPEAYVRSVLAAGFDLVEFVPEGATGTPFQDLVLMRKPVFRRLERDSCCGDRPLTPSLVRRGNDPPPASPRRGNDPPPASPRRGNDPLPLLAKEGAGGRFSAGTVARASNPSPFPLQGGESAAEERDAWMTDLRAKIARQRNHDVSHAPSSSAALASVVVLNFNGEAVVGRCLEHLRAQTHPSMEVVVVDNGSTDGSVALLEDRASRGEIRLVRSATNLGVAGGRNLGIRHCEGRIVAFLDNDAYAAPTWLERLVAKIESDDGIGAAASLVFFNRNKLVLNGAGGTLNLRGHGADWCFNVPYEFAMLPDEVLYPTGCGMAVRRDVLEVIGPHDEAIPYYGYDDVEVGIRTWLSGRRVVVAPGAWVDHDGGHAERFQPRKLLFRERGRVRNAFKYFPPKRLPSWLLHEPQIFDYLRSSATWTIPFLAWSWNLAHLRSALRWRRRFAGQRVDLSRLFYPSWRGFPWLEPDNRPLGPNPAAAGPRLVPGEDEGQLLFGWHSPRREGDVSFRRTAPAASAVVRTRGAVRLAIQWRAAEADQRCEILLRPLGDLAAVWRWSGTPPRDWERRRYDCPLAAGTYELQLLTTPAAQELRSLPSGVAVSRVDLEEI